MDDPVRTYIETSIKECEYLLEREYQTRPDMEITTSLETRLETLTEILYVLNKNAPEVATSKGKKQ